MDGKLETFHSAKESSDRNVKNCWSHLSQNVFAASFWSFTLNAFWVRDTEVQKVGKADGLFWTA